MGPAAGSFIATHTALLSHPRLCVKNLLPRFLPWWPNLSIAALAVVLFGTVFGAKLVYIGIGGSDLPNWDQWDAEAINLLQPWFEGRFHWMDLFQPHNEHRIALTKLLSLAQVGLNGQWDARFQCICNAALHAGLMVVIWLWLRRLLSARWAQAAALLAILALTATPMSWQNLLGGFHSQQVFLLGFSLATLRWLLDAPWRTGAWWIGAGCAVLAIFSMGSGFLAAAVVFGAAVVDVLRYRTWRDRLPTLCLTALIIAAGWMLRVEVPGHEPLKAHSVGEFVVSFWRACQWPNRSVVLFAVVAWIPWGWLVVRVWRAGRTADPRERIVAAAGAWVLLQYAAAAYARGAGGTADAGWPANRYLDTQALGLIINSVALLRFLSLEEPGLPRWVGAGFAALWIALLGQGLAVHLRQSFADLEVVGREMRRDELVTRAYLASDDFALLKREEILPYPSADGFAFRIRSPAIRALMPVSVRAPLPVEAASRTSNFFCKDITLHRPPPLDTPKPPGERDGLSPATPPLEYRTTWGSFGAPGPSEWESEPLTAPHGGWLKFEMAGDTHAPGVTFQLLDARTRRPVAEVRPSRSSGDSWRAAYVRAPARAFVVAARVSDPGRWLGFSQPVEMPTISHFCWWLVKSAGMIWRVSAIGVLLLAWWVLLRPARNSTG